MPAGDKLGGFDAKGWRVEWHGEAARRGDGVSGDMVRRRRGGMAHRARWWGLRRAGMGRGLGKGGVCTFGTRKKSAI